jgi:hypothetical protein
MATRRRWPFIVFGVAILFVFVGIGVIIASIAWFQENMDIERTSEGQAQDEFEKVLQMFPGREPLLELRDGVARYTKERDAAPSAQGRLSRLHVLVWNPEEEHLARIALPFWLLRMKSDPIQFSAYASGLDEEGVSLRPEDIEKYGPGIILDTRTRDGERVLLWAQ